MLVVDASVLAEVVVDGVAAEAVRRPALCAVEVV